MTVLVKDMSACAPLRQVGNEPCVLRVTIICGCYPGDFRGHAPRLWWLNKQEGTCFSENRVKSLPWINDKLTRDGVENNVDVNAGKKTNEAFSANLCNERHVG